MKHKILCIDDEQDIVDALFRLFRKNYDVLTATSGQAGLDLLQENTVSLIISDQKMPGMTGVETLKKSIAIDPECIRILLTGYTDIESVIESINSGEVYRYITKPWDPVDLVNTVEKSLEKYEIKSELKQKNIQLEKAYKELQTLDQSKTQFMYLINHELKTPLTVITSYTDLLKETGVNEEQAKFITRIQKSNDKLSALIEDVLCLIKAETNTLEKSIQPIPAQSILEHYKTKHTDELKKKNLKLNVSEKLDFTINSDLKIIKKVLDQLIDNAIKFSHEGTTIYLDAENKENKLSLKVTNSGDEVSPGFIENIFKPFTLDENMLNHTAGLGLGLSLSQALLKCLGSSLSIECENGQFKASFSLQQ